jgi:hypothetical protein
MNVMKTFILRLIVTSLCGGAIATAQSSAYTNFIRQVQFPGGISYDASVAASGSGASQLAIDPGGARFELWTVQSTTLERYLLTSTYVSSYIPVATVVIRSEDNTAAIPRTRADRPFWVDVTVSGLLPSGDGVPDAAKKVKFLRHVQSYGVGGTGIDIDRTQATLLTQTEITQNGTQNLSFQITSVPGADRTKVRGEERFSIFSLEDSRDTYKVPESQIASQYIQVWPVADGSISGIASGDQLRFQIPQVTVTLKDLYPFSTTYAQVYKGKPQPGMTGKAVTGSELIVNDSLPINKTLVLSSKDMEAAIEEDGIYTLELVTVTPFGVERMRNAAGTIAAVWFNVDRTMKMNGTFVTIK